MSIINLSSEEKIQLKNWISQMEAGEMVQVQDLIDNCDSAPQFAKTHSTYVKDWEKTKAQMEDSLREGVLPPGTSSDLLRAMIDSSQEVMDEKLKKVQDSFEKKFGESIFNYLGPDGKVKKLFGIF